jgi:hypothetical protein
LFLATVGLLLIGVGLYGLWLADLGDVLSIIVGSTFTLVGANAVYSACTARQSWLSRIGPLP